MNNNHDSYSHIRSRRGAMPPWRALFTVIVILATSVRADASDMQARKAMAETAMAAMASGDRQTAEALLGRLEAGQGISEGEKVFFVKMRNVLNASSSLRIAYFKNNHTHSIGIWINGFYQGQVPSGKTCYVVKEGFVTNDSGFQSDGRLIQKYSHAGWRSSSDGSIAITAMAYHDERDQFYWQIILYGNNNPNVGIKNNEGIFWIGGRSEISDMDKQNAYLISIGGTGGKLTLKKTEGLTPAGEDAPAKPGGYSVAGQKGDLPVLQALGSGDVTVALKWTGAPDVDLHVTDPLGETIFYQHVTSESGGQLDRDDTDGFGPENIYWSSGKAPKGNYSVRVHLYNGYSANYSLSLLVNGKRETYNGNLHGQKSWSSPLLFKIN